MYWCGCFCVGDVDGAEGSASVGTLVSLEVNEPRLMPMKTIVGTLGRAFTMATFWAMVRLLDPRFHASTAGPLFGAALIWARQLASLTVDSRAAEPPSRTTTGSVGG